MIATLFSKCQCILWSQAIARASLASFISTMADQIMLRHHLTLYSGLKSYPNCSESKSSCTVLYCDASAIVQEIQMHVRTYRVTALTCGVRRCIVWRFLLGCTFFSVFSGDPVQPALGCGAPIPPRSAQGSQGLGCHVTGSGDNGQQPLQQRRARDVGS